MSLVQIKPFGGLSIALPSQQPSHCSRSLGPNCGDYSNITKRTVSVVALHLSTVDSELTALCCFSPKTTVRV